MRLTGSEVLTWQHQPIPSCQLQSVPSAGRLLRRRFAACASPFSARPPSCRLTQAASAGRRAAAAPGRRRTGSRQPAAALVALLQSLCCLALTGAEKQTVKDLHLLQPGLMAAHPNDLSIVIQLGGNSQKRLSHPGERPGGGRRAAMSNSWPASRACPVSPPALPLLRYCRRRLLYPLPVAPPQHQTAAAGTAAGRRPLT